MRYSLSAVVISDSLWRRRYGADPAVIGKTIMLNAVPRVVVGIAPPSLLVPTGTALHPTLHELEAICEERAQLSQQKRLHHWLHGWLLVHVPLSVALLVLGLAHAVLSLYY